MFLFAEHMCVNFGIYDFASRIFRLLHVVSVVLLNLLGASGVFME